MKSLLTQKKINNNKISSKISKIIIRGIKRNYSKRKIYLHEPLLDDKDSKELNIVMKSGYVSTIGKNVVKFQNKLKKYTKSKYVVGLNSGTSALHLSLLAMGVSSDDEVLLSSLSFIASSNAVSYCGAKCIFVDIMNEGYGIDYLKLEKYLKNNFKIKNNKCINKQTGKVIKCLIVVHIFGNCNDLSKLFNICKKYKIKIIEDAAEAMGSFYKKKHLGTLGDIGIISFNGNKIITTGSGGCILTNSKKYYLKIHSLARSCKLSHPWSFKFSGLGYNYMMNNIQATLGISQLTKLKKLIENKKKIHNIYKDYYKDSKYFKFFTPPDYCRSNNWLNSIVLNKKYVKLRDDILKNLIKRKIFCKVMWPLMIESPHLKKSFKTDLKNARNLAKSVICLPSSPNIN